MWICHDAGVAMRMQYASDGSGALPYEYDPSRNGINNASGNVGHAILADGYGYADGMLYCHLNMVRRRDSGSPCLVV